MPNDWGNSEESVDEEATYAKEEDRMTNVEEEQSDSSEKVVREGDEAEVMEEDLLLVLQRRIMSQGIASLDCVGPSSSHENSSCVHERSGACRASLKVGLEKNRRRQSTENEKVSTRGWKLFLLLSWVLLYRTT